MVGRLKEYSFGCHGIEERCYKHQGKAMAFCSRCLGASIGHVFVAVNFFLFPLPVFWIAFIGMAVMYGDWHLQNKTKLYHSNNSRLISGILGGYSVGLLGWVLLGEIF